MVCAVMVAMFACAGVAFASTVHGADYRGAGSALESGEVDVLNVDGSAGETVFLTVKQGDRVIAKNLPYTIGEGADGKSGASWAGVATLDIDNLNLGQLDGTYTIQAFDSRAGGKLLYDGAIYGVYADLPNGSEKLIGVRTANDVELKARDFQPAETLYSDGQTYRLVGSATGDDGVLHYKYEAYDEAKSVDGVIKYIDADGSTIATTKIPGLIAGEERSVDIPSVVKSDDGSVYRTVYFKNSVTAVNPGQTSFSIYCTKMSDADQALTGFYVATIQMVDENGNVIATDSVNVTGEFLYTAPSVIYKTETDATTGEQTVVAYDIVQSPTVRLSAANDGVLNRARTIQVSYKAQAGEAAETTVTFNLIDGSKRANENRKLGTKTAVVTSESPTVEPDSEIEVNGAKYYVAGSTSEYAYTRGSGAVPSVDVYYLPEGYKASEAYEVTVNYMNFANDSLIESHTYTTDPNNNSRITIETPETFSADGVNYVRLAGQENAIQHSYYSGIRSYVVYYRDENDTLSSGTVIERMRVVYTDGPTTTTTTGGEDATAPAGTTTTTVIDGTTGADGTAADGTDADGTQAMQLDNTRTYNVMDGEDGNQSLTNESGVDPNRERIEDSETPLASGFDTGATSTAASSFTGIGHMIIPIIIAAAILLAAVIALIFIRRRKNDDEYEL